MKGPDIFSKMKCHDMEMCQCPNCFFVCLFFVFEIFQSWFLLMQLLVRVIETLLLFAPNKRYEYILLFVLSILTRKELPAGKTPKVTSCFSDKPPFFRYLQANKIFVFPQTCSFIFYKINLIFPSIQ